MHMSEAELAKLLEGNPSLQIEHVGEDGQAIPPAPQTPLRLPPRPELGARRAVDEARLRRRHAHMVVRDEARVRRRWRKRMTLLAAGLLAMNVVNYNFGLLLAAIAVLWLAALWALAAYDERTAERQSQEEERGGEDVAQGADRAQGGIE